MSAFSKISLGRPTKKYTHDMSFDVNTTFDFGSVQPTLVQYLEGDDSFKLSLRQLMRLAPLPVPSFARVHLQHELRFVPMADICPYYEALVAKQPYYGSGDSATLYQPDSVPYTCNRTLVQFLCLNYSDFNVLIKDNTSRQHLYQYASNKVPDGALDPSDDGDLSSLNTLLVDYWQGPYGKIGKLKVDNFEKLTYDSDEVTGGHFDTPRPDPTTKPDNATTGTTYSTITLESADFVIPVDDTYTFLFRLNSSGRRLRKVFVGCGFSLSINDTDNLSILPLLAFYKAYFDQYAPQRDVTWSSTVTYSIVKYIEEHYYIDFSTFTKDTNDDVFSLFVDFLSDLSDCWYTQLDDFVSAHRKTPVTVERSCYSPDGLDEDQEVFNKLSSAGYELPSQQAGTAFNNLTMQMIRLVTRFVNKDSVIGGKLSDWLKVHYGSDVANSLYKQSNRVGSSRLDALVKDVISSSDTASSDGGELLGSYAGQSKAYSESDNFTYEAPSFGFFVILSAVVPDTGYFQGNDSALYMLDRDTIPVPDYDALGYEVTPKGMIFDDRGVADNTITGGFGFVPRYSCYKRKRNLVNGDMSRRGSIDSYSPYYLDRIIAPKDISSIPMSDGSIQVVIHSADIPAASDAYRYTNKYRWLGNSDRIFYQSGTVYKGVSYDGDELIDDNFIVQMIFDFKVTNKYKPISQSYDTYDEGTDDGSIEVKQD